MQDENPTTGILVVGALLAAIFAGFAYFGELPEIDEYARSVRKSNASGQINAEQAGNYLERASRLRKNTLLIAGGNAVMAIAFLGLAWWSRREPVAAANAAVTVYILTLAFTAIIDLDALKVGLKGRVGLLLALVFAEFRARQEYER